MIVLRGRRAEVARLLCEGHKPKDIAKLLGIAPRTVKLHLWGAFVQAGITSEWIKHVRLVYLVSTGEVRFVDDERD